PRPCSSQTEPFDGDLDDYRRYLLSGKNATIRRKQAAKSARAAWSFGRDRGDLPCRRCRLVLASE
ncbi:MAG: hypothetical protein O7C66_03595, partial [Alphaproteobacteria bacterium]|nr:hypothetical protein [Alphaproteobacteria bacterium]